MAEHLIDSIRAEKDITKEKLDYMNEVDAMIKEMRVTYEKALGKSDSDNSNDFEVPKSIQDKTPEEKEQVVSLEERSKKKLNNTRKIKKDIA